LVAERAHRVETRKVDETLDLAFTPDEVTDVDGKRDCRQDHEHGDGRDDHDRATLILVATNQAPPSTLL